MKFQEMVTTWLSVCFGPYEIEDKKERQRRFLEEAIELSQACGASKEEVVNMVDYVYSRGEPGEIRQELGGVMTTLAVLAESHNLYMDECGDTELKAMFHKVDKIRLKQAAKPRCVSK